MFFWKNFTRERTLRLSSLFAGICGLLTAFLFYLPSACTAATYIPVGDTVYEQLRRLEAEGVIESGLLTTAPLSTKEAVRLLLEAERNSGEKSAFVHEVIKSLKERLKDDLEETKFVKPLNRLYTKYVYASSGIKSLYYNNDGDVYNRGSNERAGFTARADLGNISFEVEPELRRSGESTAVALKRAYGVISFAGLDLVVGKDSQWWGPGYHGAIMLSNNAKPLTMVRLTNPKPVLLPWIFKSLGPFKVDFFATRLEAQRAGPAEPYFWGLRLNFKPHPYVEIGLSRTAILGGSGRPAGLSTWLKSFTGAGENVGSKEAGDQKAGFDIKVTAPFEVQPLQLYTEAIGEDEAGFLPSRWAFLAGIYLPRILSLERLSLRGEYATNHISGYPNYWYTHHIYYSYAYNGQIIGHHMGTDSRDIFVELSYLIPELNGRISFSYDREEHNLSGQFLKQEFRKSGPGREKKDEGSLSIDLEMAEGFMVNALWRYAKFRDFENITGNDIESTLVAGGVEYSF